MKRLLPLIAVLCGMVTRADEDELKLERKAFDKLSNRDLQSNGKAALEMTIAGENLWLHAETPHWILHYQREQGIENLAKQLEYLLRFIAEALGARPEDYAKKGHVFVFFNQDQWDQFCKLPKVKMEFAGSFVSSGHMYLNVRESERTGGLNVERVAHEVSHAVTDRLYPDKSNPRWLEEGLADYMGATAPATMRSERKRARLRLAGRGDLDVRELTKINHDFPAGEEQRLRVYAGGEQLVRFLLDGNPRERFRPFMEKIMNGWDFERAMLSAYGDLHPSLDAFQRAYDQFKAR